MAGFGAGGFGGAFGGGGPIGAPAAGLPFAGIPPELQERVDRLLETEPEDQGGQGDVEFSHVDYDRRPFSLRTFLAPYRWALAGTLLVVLVETLAMQAGPLLTQRAIDDGIGRGDKGTVVTMAALYLVAVVISTAAGWARVSWTGRTGERLMLHLRVRIFAHLQRLSVPFFTQ